MKELIGGIFRLENLAGIFYAFVALSALVVVHEWGHFFAAIRSKVRVEVFSIGFGKKLFSRKRGDTEFAVSAMLVGGYVKLAGDNPAEFKGKPDDFLAQKARTRAAIVLAGPLMNYLLGFVLFAFVFMIGFPKIGTHVGEVLPGAGAEKAGIRAGDEIVAVEGRPTPVWDTLTAAVRGAKDRDSLNVTVRRGQERFETVVFLKQRDSLDELMQKRKVPQLGIRASTDLLTNTVTVRYGFFQAAGAGAAEVARLTVMTYKALWFMVTGRLAAGDSMTGPVGIFEIFKNVRTLADFLILSAVLSVSLALFNVLPIPILDGGHIFFIILEKIRGRAITKETEEKIFKVAMTLLLALMAFVTVNDIIRFGYVSKVQKSFQPAHNQTVVPDGGK